jgi:acetyl-CoA carboxylase biotin carboxyl carrier protein
MPKAKNTMNSHDQAIDKVVDLIKFMGENRLSELELETSDLKLSLKKHTTGHLPGLQHHMPSMPMPVMQFEPLVAPVKKSEKPVAANEKAAPAAVDKYKTIVSPMTGTFYRSPSPDSQPFIKEGDVLKSGQTICIVEAMKMMNEIKSDKAGKVLKILIENGKPVEKGTVLVHLEE